MTPGVRAASAFVAVTLIAVLIPACAPPVATDPPPGASGPSAGCGVTTRGPVTERAATVKVDNATRRFSLTVPEHHKPGTTDPLPLVLDFHGLLEGWAGTHPFATQFSAKAQAEGFIVAFPIGSDPGGGGDGINWDISPDERNADLRFIDTLLAELSDTLCIDRSRIYITGLSYGAFMTSMLMCMRPNTFAAAAPVAGIWNMCHPTERSVPFVTFHGTADWILPYPLFENTPAAIAAKYGCDPTPASATLQPTPDPATYGAITHHVWRCDEAGTAAESYVIAGGGHSWPGSEFFRYVEFIVGPTATSIDATDIIWDFFSRHRL